MRGVFIFYFYTTTQGGIDDGRNHDHHRHRPCRRRRGADPPAEQRTAFQKFWDSLFGGKEEPAPGSGEGTKKDGDPAPKEGEGTKQEPQGGKSYSEADVEAKIAEAKAAWEAEQQEKQRLAKLSPEERAKAEGEAQAQELTKLRTELLQRDLKDAAVKKLTDEGFPVGLADLLTYTDKESMEKSPPQTPTRPIMASTTLPVICSTTS